MTGRFVLAGREFYATGRLIRTCGLFSAWYEEVDAPRDLVEALRQSRRRLDVFTFFQRVPDVTPRYEYHRETYGVAVMQISTYEQWWTNAIGKNARQAVKRAQKNGIEVRVAAFDDRFIKGISEIYNETPIRQGRPFPHYGDSLQKVKAENGTFRERSVFIGAYREDELVGFAKLVFETRFCDLLQFLSKVSQWDKGVNNALLAKAVEVCAARGVKYLAYGDMRNDGLDDFKRRNGFVRMDLPRYYVPLSRVGAVAIALGLHRPLSTLLPRGVVRMLKELRRRWYRLRVA